MSTDHQSRPASALGAATTRRRRPWVLASISAAIVVVIGVVVGVSYAHELSRDSDADGITDTVETAGWRAPDGSVFVTDPHNDDTDRDGLSDQDEAGERWEGTENTYTVISSPLLADTDKDGLTDPEEIELGLDAFERDSDDDQLDDYVEVAVIGSSALLVDTDADGFDDAFEVANRSTDGLDPLLVNEVTDAQTVADDFATGAFLGELEPRASVAWLAGNLAAGGSSVIPIIGPVVGGVADIRDAVGSALQGDWVGVGLSSVGLIPVAGDAATVPAKVAKFVARHPELAVAVASTVAAIKYLPDEIKAQALRKVWASWDELIDSGYSKRTLFRLVDGNTDLDKLNAALRRSGHVNGAPARFFDDGLEGERHLEATIKATGATVITQKVVSTQGCNTDCRAKFRRFDIFDATNGVAHESKVGYKRLTPELEMQIRSDAYAVSSGGFPEVKRAHWHFYASTQTGQIGADQKVLDLLDELKISYTIHRPVA